MGVADLNVKIGADISEVLSKVDAAKAKLNQLTETNQDLKNNIKELNNALSANQKELNSTDKALQKLIASGKGSSQAAKDLRAQIAAVNTSTAELSGELSIAQKELVNNTAQVKIHAAELKKAETAGSGFAKGATQIYSGLRKLAYILPGIGIAGIVNIISGPLIDAFELWYDSINKVTDAQQLLKDNIKNTSDINKAAGEEIAKQTASLTTLYSIATDVSRSMYDRLNATKALQKEFPDYFKNISTENILNGNAKKAYDALTDSLIANALAKAQLDKITDLGVKKSDAQSEVDDLIAERKRQLAAVNGAKISNPSLGNSTGSPATVITADQQKADIVTFFDRQLIPLQSQIKGFDAQIKLIRGKLNPEALLSDDGGNSKSGPAATGILAILDAQIKVLKDYKDKIATTADQIASVNAQIKKLQAERDKLDPADAKKKKEVETIADVLKKLGVQIDFLNQKEILLKTSQAKEKISAVETAINTLMQKFKLLSDNPIILKLETQIKAVQADDFLKHLLPKGNDLKGNKPIAAPYELQLEIDKIDPEIKLPGGFSEDILRDELLKRLKEMGIDKTVSIPLGVDIFGNKVSTKGDEPITPATPTAQLQGTYDDAIKRLEKFRDDANKIVDDIDSS